MKTITLILDDELEERLREVAKTQGGRSVSSLVREFCTDGLIQTEIDSLPNPPSTGPEEDA